MMATAAPLKVLVVDDEPAIRRFLRTSLTAHRGNTTYGASSSSMPARC
jgi:CheY-like chemotaxis protein